MPKKMGLGRGLDAILPDVEDTVETIEKTSQPPVVTDGQVVEIPLGDIDPNLNQPRKRFDPDALAALAESIRHSGVISPILVARNGNRYTLIAGERRWRAARQAGLRTIPALVREWDEIHRQEAMLIENIQRENLNPIEEAQGIARLMEECALTQEQVAERLGRSRPAIANLVRLLHLPAQIQESISEGKLSAGHGRVLAGIEDEVLQTDLFFRTLNFEWSVRQLEDAAKKASQEKKPREPQPELPAEYSELLERLRSSTGLQVTLSGNEQAGKIVLRYASQDELQKLWDLLGAE